MEKGPAWVARFHKRGSIKEPTEALQFLLRNQGDRYFPPLTQEQIAALEAIRVEVAIAVMQAEQPVEIE